MYYVDPIGSIKVAELDWGNEDHIKALEPPFDFIIGTDVVSSLRLTHFYIYVRIRDYLFHNGAYILIY